MLLLFRQFKEQLGLSLILITHNPGLLAGFADRVAVLYAGEIVELGPADAVLQQPQHPYTRALLQCMPLLDANNGTELDSRLPVIAGDPPDLSAPAGGCRFAPRCPERMEICTMREPV
ncbi:MAG: dipeptide/oligopeptide/nickel ABC transporter ATP-binding protein, partial [Acidobacteria bacterium]